MPASLIIGVDHDLRIRPEVAPQIDGDHMSQQLNEIINVADPKVVAALAVEDTPVLPKLSARSRKTCPLHLIAKKMEATGSNKIQRYQRAKPILKMRIFWSG